MYTDECVHIYIYIYIYIHNMYRCIHIYIYIHSHTYSFIYFFAVLPAWFPLGKRSIPSRHSSKFGAIGIFAARVCPLPVSCLSSGLRV